VRFSTVRQKWRTFFQSPFVTISWTFGTLQKSASRGFFDEAFDFIAKVRSGGEAEKREVPTEDASKEKREDDGDDGTPKATQNEEKAPKNDKEDGIVLVHSNDGASRAPAIVAAYLMKAHGMSLLEALTALKAARSQMQMNRNLLKELLAYEQTLRGFQSVSLVECRRAEWCK